MESPDFQARGLGYAIRWPQGVELAFSHLRRERIGLTAHLRVSCDGPGLPTGLIHQARQNLSTHTTRSTLAKYLGGRTNGAEVGWVDIIEQSFGLVLDADAMGSPVEDVDVDMARTELPYLVRGFARRGVVTWLFGPGGSGKTTLLTALGMSVAAGRELVPGLPPAFRGTVLYLDWETDRADFSHRAGLIARGAGMEGAGRILYRRCERPVADEAEELSRIVTEREAILVIMDSAGLAIGHGSDGMEAAEPTLRFFRACRVLHSTVIVGDHVTKAARGKYGATPYGSIYKENLSRASWELRRASQLDQEVRLGLHLRKANDRASTASLGLRVHYNEDGITFTADDAPADAEQTNTTAARAMKYLTDGGDGATTELMAGMLDLAPSTVQRALYRLRKKGLVDRDDAGRWMVTPQAVGASVGAD